MNICKPAFSSPVLCIDSFLSSAEAQCILQEALDLKKIFMPARVFDGPSATKVDPAFRSNEVVYLDEVFRSCPQRSDILRIMKEKIWTPECRALWHEGYSIFDIINYATSQEAVLSRYGNGDFYKRHQDTRWDRITNRLVTIVYYVSVGESDFTGGQLVLSDSGNILRLQPKHNRAVVFPSFMTHEVERVTVENEAWECGRFSLNYWVGFR